MKRMVYDEGVTKDMADGVAMPQAMQFVMVPTQEWERIINALQRVESILNRPKDDNWITAKEACAMLGCKERAFLVKRRAYRLKVLEVGRNKLIRRSDVERIIQAEAYAE
ncbi:MAG: helix-turn-helix domain-containing protein [Prevotella sp.]|nr:helix-turn-helix domain-containing protein [Prevotella sp.]MDY5665903.1 helix-turn-helix domain-containing protein [Alloprevotella sp.]